MSMELMLWNIVLTGALALVSWFARTMTAYRQALRDITNTYASLDEVVWPVKP